VEEEADEMFFGMKEANAVKSDGSLPTATILHLTCAKNSSLNFLISGKSQT